VLHTAQGIPGVLGDTVARAGTLPAADVPGRERL